MRNETIATRNLKEYVERNNSTPSREDIMNILAMLPLFIKPSFDEIELIYEEKNKESNIKNETKKQTRTRKTKENNEQSNAKSNNVKNTDETSIKNTSVNNEKKSVTPNNVLEDVKMLQEKLGKMPTMQQLKENNIDVKTLINTYGNWRSIKNSLNNPEKANELVELTKKLNRIPTMNDIKENNINIEDLLLKYGSWKNIKKELNLTEVYENILQQNLMTLKNSTKLTFNNCKENGIDVNYLMRKYGSWKEALNSLGV